VPQARRPRPPGPGYRGQLVTAGPPAGPPDPGPARAGFGEVFKVAEFRALWFSQVLSVAGDRLALVALALLVYDRTRSPLLTAAAYAAGYLPWVIGGLFLAGIADRRPRRTVMVCCDLVRAVLVAVMAAPGVPLGALVALLFTATMFAPPFESARASITPDILPGEQYPLGTSVLQATLLAGQVAGAAGGGVTVAVLGVRPALVIDAATFAASAVLVGLGTRARPAAAAATGPSPLAGMRDGFRVVFGDRALRTLLLFGLLVVFYTVPEGIAAPYAARLGGGPVATGLVLASTVLATAAGTPLFTRLTGPARRLELMGPLAVATCATLMLTALHPGLAVSLVIFSVSAGFGVYQIAANTAFVVRVPGQRRAQAFGIAAMGVVVGQGAGFVAAGAAAQVISPAAVIAAAGAAGAVIAAGLSVSWRRLPQPGAAAARHVPRSSLRGEDDMAHSQLVTEPAGPAGDGDTGPPPAGREPETGPRGRRRLALANWRVRWRLAAVIAVPAAVAVVFGGVTIDGDLAAASLAGRVQRLAQLTASVVQLTQALEDEQDLSAGYAADRAAAGPLAGRLAAAQALTGAAARAVRQEAAGVTAAAGYAPATVQNLQALADGLNDLRYVRMAVASSQFPASQIIGIYSGNIIAAASTFTASAGNGTSDPDLQGDVSTLTALLRAENDMSAQRAILFAALSSAPPVLTSQALASLQQAQQQQGAGQADFAAAAGQAGQQAFSNTVSGPAVDLAASQESLAESLAAAGLPLTARGSGLTAPGWYANQTGTITRTRQVTAQLVTAITTRAAALRSQAARNLLATSVITVVLLALVVLVSAAVARSLTRPLRKLRTDALDVAGRRLPAMVRQLADGDTAEALDVDPVGVTTADEIGEVARAFDQVHREAVRLAGNEAGLRATLNAMFINLSRRSQSLIERQLSLIDSLEQSEQDSGRLSSLFRLDHLATRMRRNSENLLVLAGYEVTRRWAQPVPLVDVLRAAISEIDQYDRVVLTVQPGIVVTGQAVSDVVHLAAELVENATAFSPGDTQVHVSGQALASGGVLVEVTDHGTGLSAQEIADANWRLDNPPVVDVAVSRRMGLFVVGRLAARHGIRVRLQRAPDGGLTALIWLPDTVTTPHTAPPGRLRAFEPAGYGPAPSLSAPPAITVSPAAAAVRSPRFSPAPPPPAAPGTLVASAPAARNSSSSTVPDGGAPDRTPADPGAVPVPAAAARDQRLPIYDSLESEWFRRGGTLLGARETGAQVPAQASWISPADEGWRAAQAITSPAAGETTHAGLPRRIPRANLVPGSAGRTDAETRPPARSADEVRTRMAGFQQGIREGRAAAPQPGDPQDR
jgi:signal transduction histidine kinase/predicted MFS family arabinose efflux permease